PPGGDAMPPSVIVNDAMAHSQWPGMNAVGRCLRFSRDGDCYRVVGVVETSIVRTLLEPPQAQYYLPLDHPPVEAGRWFSTLVVRVQPRGRDRVITELRGLLRAAFPSGRPALTPVEQLLAPQYRPWKLSATLFSACGLLALVIAAVGIFSTVTYS